MNELVFHIIFVIAYLSMIGIRAISARTATRNRDRITFKESALNMGVRAVIGIGYVVALLVYIVYPRYLDWAIFPVPLWARWLGAVLSLGTIPLLAWVHWALGKNFSTTLHVRDQHTLVTHGPYRWVRHPMYTVLFAFGVGLMLVTANGVVGGPMAVALAGIAALRVSKEEALMIERFGDDYREYMRRTGRFLPRLWHPGCSDAD